MITEYQLTLKDFKKAFTFGINYHLDPRKTQSGRTTNEPRGLGGVLDNFVRGKLLEIGTTNIIREINHKIECNLDFQMHSPTEVRTDPDIVSIIEHNKVFKNHYEVESYCIIGDGKISTTNLK